MLGGHVGIEGDSNQVLNFLPAGQFHWIAKKEDRHSAYAVHTTDNFYAILGGNPDNVKKAVISIPVSSLQKQKFDSIQAAYLAATPYDYALVGMRCGAAAYEILGQLEILPRYNNQTTYKKIVYPKKLRKRLFKKAIENGWSITRQEGTTARKWEQD